MRSLTGLGCADKDAHTGKEWDDIRLACYRAARDFPQLLEVLELDLGIESKDILYLNQLGIEKSDVIGPWLFSENVQGLMDEYELKEMVLLERLHP